MTGEILRAILAGKRDSQLTNRALWETDRRHSSSILRICHGLSFPLAIHLSLLLGKSFSAAAVNLEKRNASI